MKILHVCETAVGGIASYLNIIGTIDDDVRNVFLVPEDHVRDIDSAMVVRTYPAKGRSMTSLLSHIRSFRTVVDQENPDLIFFHSTFSLTSLLALRMAGDDRPALYCSHGWAVSRYPEGSLKARVASQLEGRLCGLANQVINISKADHELAARLGYRGDHALIENAVPDAHGGACKSLHENEPDLLHLLFVGRLDRQKGLDILLASFSKARAARTDLRLRIIGSAIRADGGQINLPEGVTLVGWVDRHEIDSWYASADAVLVPSRWEGFGLVVPEALRNGTPVLCSNRGALPGLVAPGVTGEIFSLEGGDLQSMLEHLDKDRLREMRPACRAAYEERFKLERFRREITQSYEGALRRD